MRILRYAPPDPYRGSLRAGVTRPEGAGEARWGILEGDWVQDLLSAPFEDVRPGKARFRLDEVRLKAPVNPSKIVAVGMNYEGHIREMGHSPPSEPLLFLKAPSSIIPAGDAIFLPPESSRVDYEGELAVVVGRRCRRIGKDEAPGCILGYTILNDVTARDLQKKDVQYSRAKSFDTFCPIGPWIETDLDPAAVDLTTVVNSELRQDANTSTMIFSPFELLSYASSAMTLQPGDVLATGTPAGVGPLAPGDSVSVAIEGIGVLTNPVLMEVR